MTSLTSLIRLFSAGPGPNERPAIRREQALTLSTVNIFFIVLGVASCSLFTAEFYRKAPGLILSVYGAVIALYVALGVRTAIWHVRRDDTGFIRHTAVLLAGLGITWGTLVNLFSVHLAPERTGILIGLIMALVSTPMLAVPIEAALSFYLPAALLCSVAVTYTLQPIPAGAIEAFFGFLIFAFVGLVNMNKMLLDRSIGRLQLQREHATIRLFLREFEETSSDWLWETDASGCLRDVHRRLGEALQLDPALLEGRPLGNVIACSGSADANQLCDHLAGRTAFRDLRIGCVIDGKPRVLNATGHPVFDEMGAFQGFRGIGSDITEACEAQACVEYLARFDDLTGLLNRRAFVETVTQCSQGAGCALLLVDLDNFKRVNDDFGHSAGDALLRMVASRIRSVIRDQDTGGRIGGDEFAILLHPVSKALAIDIAERLVLSLHSPAMVDGILLSPSASIGLAFAPERGISADQLMKRADLALYKAKGEGKDTFHVFSASMEPARFRHASLEVELAHAIDNGDLFVEYQPIYDLRSMSVSFAEALVRWRHATRGLITASDFVPNAERSELIERLGDYVLDTACGFAGSHRLTFAITVNVSARQFETGRLVEQVARTLARHGLSGGKLVLEITETALLAVTPSVVGQIDALRGLGVQIMLDDFGSGFSSMSHLSRFTVDGIKIEGGFTRDIASARSASAVVDAMLGMSEQLGICAIVEGIETEQQLDYLRAHGARYGQGYLLARPVAARDLVTLVEAARMPAI